MVYGLVGLMVLICAGFVLGENNVTMIASVNILAPAPDVIGVAVPDSIDFGNVTAGEESDIFDIYINNTGNVAITVVPELVDDSEEIFSYLFFRRVQSDAFTRIGDFSVNISKPVAGGVKTQRTYVMLDLENFDGVVNESILDHQANIFFWAVPQ